MWLQAGSITQMDYPCLHAQSVIRVSLSIQKHPLPTWYLGYAIFSNHCYRLTGLDYGSQDQLNQNKSNLIMKQGPPAPQATIPTYFRWCDQATPHVLGALWPSAALSAAWRQIREKRGRDVAYSHAEWVYIKWESCSLNMKLTIHKFDQA